MLTKLRLVFSTTIVFFSFYVSAQSKYWERETAQNNVVKKVSRDFNVKKGSFFSFREKLFKQDLKSSSSKKGINIVYFPNDVGSMIAYRVKEAPVLSPSLSKRYPEIKSYAGYAVDGSNDKIRFSISHKEVQAMIVHGDGSANSFVQKASDDKYMLYSRASTDANVSDFICSTEDKLLAQHTNTTAKPVDGQVLRKYRLAISATAEYTDYHGGTVADALAAINATVTRVNEVFETDLAVTLELVADTDKVIYTDATTDPYSTTNLGALGSQAQNTLTAEIGDANYDIGHVLHKGENGGNAGFIGAICVDGRKGTAYSSGQVPEGDTYDLDFVAHEMGHQLGANHTWSHELEGTLVQVEPGSGSTIMGYAGITQDDNVQQNGDDYFHYFSIEQIIENLKTKTCGEVVALSNVPPVVAAIGDFTIPKSTAFVLTGSATDADADDMLSYTWEQIDNGVVTRATFGPTNASGANFRSRPPSTDPTRYFPLLSRVIEGNLTQTNPDVGSVWETVSDVEREMKFAFTVRDNAPGGGQVVSELVDVFVTNGAGPFAILSQATAESWVAGEKQEVVWDVARTNVAPVNTETVDIMLSTDGGLTFSVVLAEDVINDGSHEFVVPGLPTAEARIMVRPTDNIYYAVNAVDISIEASEIVMNFSDLSFDICHFDDLTIPFIYETYLDFNEETTFSVVGAPENLEVSFSPETVIAGDTPIDLIIENTENVPEGSYALQVTATAASVTKQLTLNMNIYDTDFPDVLLTAPANGLIDASANVPMEWEDNLSHTSFEIEIASDPSFGNIIENAIVHTNVYIPIQLQNQTTYFWRVKPLNVCGEGSFSSPFSFTTVQVSCDDKTAKDLPLPIARTGRPTITSKITFFEDLPLTDINVTLKIDHSYIGDLTVNLTSPSGTVVSLISNSCGELDNIDATFDDDATSFICGSDSNTAISGLVKPLGSLSSFEGESIFGEWILEISDNADPDGGALSEFSLDICVEGAFRPDADNDGVFDDGDDLCPDTPEGSEVDANGCPIFRFPIDNFSVSVQSESCRNNDDGAIQIDVRLPLEYEITVTGNGLNLTDNFTTTFLLSDLNSGTYTLCVNGSDANFDYEEYCFEVMVSQPEPLGVTSKISEDGMQIVLSMNGADRYTVELNGKTVQTEKSEITLNLRNGNNALRVSTDLSCQGVYENQVFVSDEPIVFPNPFYDSAKMFLSVPQEELSIDIYNVGGRLIKSGKYATKDQEIDIDFVGLPPGIYFIKYKGKKVKGTAKVVKR